MPDDDEDDPRQGIPTTSELRHQPGNDDGRFSHADKAASGQRGNEDRRAADRPEKRG